jgi:hypothetical protein
MKFTLRLSSEEIEKIRQRRIFVFDISIWNTLADGRDSDSIEICEILLAKVRDGSLFCPLTAPAIWELRKQAGESFMRTASLMEQLSMNVAFRGIYQIFDYEIDHLIKYALTGNYEHLSVGELFGPLLSYLAPSFKIEYPYSNITDEERGITESISKLVQSTQLTALMAMIGERSSPGPKTAPNYKDKNIERRNITKGDQQKMRRIEIEDVARSIVIPKLNKRRSMLPIETQIQVVNAVSNFPRSKKYDSAIEYMLGFLPMISSYIHVLTISGYDINRKDTENDFYDREIAIYGLSYASVFAAKDKWIRHLMKLAKADGSIGSLSYVGSLSELRTRL